MKKEKANWLRRIKGWQKVLIVLAIFLILTFIITFFTGMSPMFMIMQGLSIFILLWHVSLIFLALLILSIFFIYNKKRKINRNIISLLTYPFLLPIIISILGAIFYDTRSNFANYLILALYLINLVYLIILIIKTRNYRLFLFSIAGLLLLFTFGVMFVAGMSIANEWI